MLATASLCTLLAGAVLAAPTPAAPAAPAARVAAAARVSLSPYDSLPPGLYKGQLHAHTVFSDGSGTPEGVLAAYRDLGCDWVALTDHDLVTTGQAAGVLEVSGCERTVRPTDDHFGHMLLYGLDAVPASSTGADNVAAARFSALAHAGWELTWGRWTVADAERAGVSAVEVYNGYQSGVLSESLWDQCLSAGVAPFCTVGDDMHNVAKADRVGASVMAWADAPTSPAILDALASGTYYCTLGPRLTITTDAGRITVASPDACDWQFIGEGGRVLAQAHASREAGYGFAGDESYVRVKAVRIADGRAAWTNPVFFSDWETSLAIGDGSAQTASSPVDLHVTATSDLAPVTGMRVSRDGGPWSAWQTFTTTYACDLGPDDGPITVRVQLRDRLGTVFTTPAAAVTLDRRAPRITSLSSPTHPDPDRWYSDPGPGFAWAATDAGGLRDYTWSLDASAAANPGDGRTSTVPATAYGDVRDGVWYFHVRARDVAGNRSDTSTLRVRIDTHGPVTAARGAVTVRRGARASLSYLLSDKYSRSVDVTVVIRRGAASVKVLHPGRQAVGTARCSFRSDLPRGTYRYEVRARDLAGNPQSRLGSGTLTVV